MELGCVFISCSISLWGGKPDGSWSGNTSLYSFNSFSFKSDSSLSILEEAEVEELEVEEESEEVGAGSIFDNSISPSVDSLTSIRNIPSPRW